MTPAERTKRARHAAHAMHAKHDSKDTTAKARATFLKRFEDQVDPDRTLAEEERARRVDHARKAHYSRLAYLSAKARSEKRSV